MGVEHVTASLRELGELKRWERRKEFGEARPSRKVRRQAAVQAAAAMVAGEVCYLRRRRRRGKIFGQEISNKNILGGQLARTVNDTV